MFTISVLGIVYVGLTVVATLYSAYWSFKLNTIVPTSLFDVGMLVLFAVFFLTFGWTAVLLSIIIALVVRSVVNLINRFRGGKTWFELAEEYQYPLHESTVGNSSTHVYSTSTPEQQRNPAMSQAFAAANDQATA